jgi:hypothetical protein
MSDLQDLIHTNAHNAYEIGVRTERERIIKLLDGVAAGQAKLAEFNPNRKDRQHRELAIATTYQLVALIKGEPK